MTSQPQHIRRLGPFVLGERLAKTPHSRVWWATAPDGSDVVVKELSHPAMEPYRRFRDEVAFHLRGPHPGVLQVVDAYVPESPSKASPAWLAMLPARVCEEALNEKGGQEPRRFERLVEAFAAYAATLARLAAGRVFHRDLKPDNLFERDGEWLVGDFGLVSFPDKSQVTVPGQKLGPAHFMAPEMVDDATTAMPGPADVWALAKSLWALAANGRWPMPGQLRIEDEKTRLSARVGHPRAVHLERMLELATRLDPMRRPSMQEFSDELVAWSEQGTGASSSGPIDLDQLAARVSAFAESVVRDRDTQERERAINNETFRGLLAAWERLGPEMARFGEPLEEDSGLLFHLDARGSRRDQTLISSIARHVAVPGYPNISLSAEVGFEAFDEPLIRMAGTLYVRSDHRNPVVIWTGVRQVIPGSTLGVTAAAELGRELQAHFGEAAQRFADLVATAGAARQRSRQRVMSADGDTYRFRTEVQGGVITILRQSDGSRDGSAVVFHGVPIDEIRADGNRVWWRSAGREGFVERNARGHWVMASEQTRPPENSSE